MGEFVRIETEGGVATIRIDRPPANALARAVSLELSEAAETVTGDDAVRAVVVWGGERIFAAGADIKAMVGYGPEEVAEDVGASRAGLPRPRGDPEGHDRRDQRVRARRRPRGRARVRLPVRRPGRAARPARDQAGDHPRLGRHAAAATPGRSREGPRPDLHGPAGARRPRRSTSGSSTGSHRRTRSTGSPSTRPRTFATGPSLAFAAAKRALAAADRPLEEGLRVEREAFVALFATRDQEEGMRAFLDKREPRFEGR